MGSYEPQIFYMWYEKLSNNDFKKMKKKIVIDSRRILAQKQLAVDYYAIGLGKE